MTNTGINRIRNHVSRFGNVIGMIASGSVRMLRKYAVQARLAHGASHARSMQHPVDPFGERPADAGNLGNLVDARGADSF